MPIPLSNWMCTLILPASNLILMVISQVDLSLTQVVPSCLIHMDLSSLPVHCHQERPIEILSTVSDEAFVLLILETYGMI